MGLSSSEAKEKISTYQAIIDLIQVAKELAAMPDFKQLAKDAYDLPEQAKAKASSASKLIAELDAKLLEQRQNEARQLAEQEYINSQKENLRTLEAEISAKLNNLNVRSNDLSTREKLAIEKAAALATRETAVAERENKVVGRENALLAEMSKFEAEKEEARKRAEEIRKLSERL